MQSLKTLRDYLLARLPLNPEDVTTLASNGTIRNHYQRDGERGANGLRFEYTAELYLLDFTLAPEIIGHLVGEWLNENHPGHDGKDISFEAEIINHDSVDLHVKISGITDRYLCEETADGMVLRFIPAVPADPLITANAPLAPTLIRTPQPPDKVNAYTV